MTMRRIVLGATLLLAAHPAPLRAAESTEAAGAQPPPPTDGTEPLYAPEPRWSLPPVRVVAKLADPLGPFPLATTRLDRRERLFRWL